MVCLLRAPTGSLSCAITAGRRSVK